MKKIIKIIAFVCLIAILLLSIINVFSFTYSDGIRQIDAFYNQTDNTVDVLVLGSSHSFLNIYTEILWREYGIASFNLSASMQPIWSSYYYLVEALKTQTPRVIVLEGYRLTETDDYLSKGTTIKNLYGMKFSKNKLEALKTSVPEDKKMAEQLGLKDVEYELFNYHSRYAELKENDVLPYYGEPIEKYSKGSMCGLSVYSEHDTPDVNNFSQDRIPLSEKTEEYYRKMFELATENDIPMVTVIAPFTITQEEYSMYLYAKDISDEYGQSFIDYNEYYEEMELDFKTDILDSSGHLNKSGAEKFTTQLGRFLVSNYELTDRRGDDTYSSWEDNAVAYHRLYEDGGLGDISDTEEYVMHALNEGNYEFIFTLNGVDSADDEFKADVIRTFSALGIEITDPLCDGVWIYNGEKLKYETHKTEYFKKAYRFDRYNDALITYGKPDDASSENSCFYIVNDDNTISKMERGFMIYSYDKMISVNTHTMFYGIK